MLAILTRSEALNYALATGYASGARKISVVALSGFYLAGVGWWAGTRIAAAWRERSQDSDDPRDQLL